MLKFWPSRADIWASYEGCTGFAKFHNEVNPVMKTNEDAQRGINLHKKASDILLGSDYNAMDDPDLTYYINECNKLEGQKLIEIKLSYLGINTRIDFACIGNNEITIIDLKTGKVPVKAFLNWQLLTMCFIFINNYGKCDDTKINLKIIQPYVFTGEKIDTWTRTVKELKPYFDQIINAIQMANSDMAVLKSGDHCKYCPLLSKCHVALKAGVSLFEVASKISVDRDINVGKRLSYIERAFNHLNSLKKVYEVEATEKLKNGDPVQGYCLKTKSSALKWSIPDTSIENLGTSYNLNLFKKTPLTPKQVIDDKGISKNIIGRMSHRITSKVLSEFNVNKLIQEK